VQSLILGLRESLRNKGLPVKIRPPTPIRRIDNMKWFGWVLIIAYIVGMAALFTYLARERRRLIHRIRSRGPSRTIDLTKH